MKKLSKLILAITVIITGACSSGYQGPKSDHFDGTRFYMDGNGHGFSDMIKWLWDMETVDWPDWIDDPVQAPPPATLSEDQLRVTYVNHATVLIQISGLNILTDPIWSKTAGPVSWLGVSRIRNPGVAFEKLPKIDLVLISHDHYDHLDLPTLKMLEERDRPRILAGLGLKSYLQGQGFNKVNELDWWQSVFIQNNKVEITFVPALHASGRLPFQGNMTLWGGFVLSAGAKHVYFAGDSGYGNFIPQIADRFGSFQLTILPIGSYEKRWFMKNQHMNPDDAVKAHIALNSKQSVGMHFATFAEHPEQTINAHEIDLAEALKKYGVDQKEFWVLQFGDGKFVNP